MYVCNLHILLFYNFIHVCCIYARVQSVTSFEIFIPETSQTFDAPEPFLFVKMRPFHFIWPFSREKGKVSIG
jgi:hypothetical protein